MDKRQIKYEGEIELGNFTIPCYVLDDGTRILSGRGMQEALKMVDEVEDGKQTSGTRLQRYLGQKTLEPFIHKDKEQDHYNPIICYKGSQKINGYEATVLADICDAFLEARKNIPLSPRQKIIAEQCEILIRGFAKVGIIALVDEATGYQHDREQDELQKILKAYISEELLPWQKKFPDIYYQELFRLNGWDFTVKGIQNRPSCIGRWTNTIIYEQLPQDVLKTLKERTPKSEHGNRLHRFHQLLTVDVGDPNLNAQIQQILALFKISDNMQQFWQHFAKLQDRNRGQLQLPFSFDNKGHTISPKEHNDVSGFDKTIKQALDYNPNKD